MNESRQRLATLLLQLRLRSFDRATARQSQRDQELAETTVKPPMRGWRRDELYDRHRTP